MSALESSQKASFTSTKTHELNGFLTDKRTNTHKGALKYDWENKWLKGEEYAHMLNNLDAYCKSFNLDKLSTKTHPPSIYTEPKNGMIYFVEGNSVGSDFGFPRVDTKKHYRWKKMNFTTDLPKKRPYVTYIVASAVKCERFFPNSKDEGPSYRMHAVILNKDRIHTQKYKSKTTAQTTNEFDENSQALSSTCSSAESLELEKNEPMIDESAENKHITLKGGKNYILCHIRKIDSNYKSAKSSTKKDSLSKEEIDDQEDEEEEDDEDEEIITKKLFVSKEQTSSGQESPLKISSPQSPQKIRTLKIISADIAKESDFTTESPSPLESLKSKVTSPGLPKLSFLGIGSKNSAFNTFQTPCITPRFVTNLEEIPKKIKTLGEVRASKTAVDAVIKDNEKHKLLFEAFNFGSTKDLDYLQIFNSLINVKKSK